MYVCIYSSNQSNVDQLVPESHRTPTTTSNDLYVDVAVCCDRLSKQTDKQSSASTEHLTGDLKHPECCSVPFLEVNNTTRFGNLANSFKDARLLGR